MSQTRFVSAKAAVRRVPPTGSSLEAMQVAHPRCRIAGRQSSVTVPVAIGMEVRVRGRGRALFYVEAITDDDMLLSADGDGVWELHAPAADLIATGNAEHAIDAGDAAGRSGAPADALPSLAKGWRLTPAGHVRDVTLIPGSRVWWLSPHFDRIDRPSTVTMVGRAEVRLGKPENYLDVSGRELHVSHESAVAALARRMANDRKRGRPPCCPTCFLRVGAKVGSRCEGCHYVWPEAGKGARR